MIQNMTVNLDTDLMRIYILTTTSDFNLFYYNGKFFIKIQLQLSNFWLNGQLKLIKFDAELNLINFKYWFNQSIFHQFQTFIDWIWQFKTRFNPFYLQQFGFWIQIGSDFMIKILFDYDLFQNICPSRSNHLSLVGVCVCVCVCVCVFVCVEP